PPTRGPVTPSARCETARAHTTPRRERAMAESHRAIPRMQMLRPYDPVRGSAGPAARHRPRPSPHELVQQPERVVGVIHEVDARGTLGHGQAEETAAARTRVDGGALVATRRRLDDRPVARR